MNFLVKKSVKIPIYPGILEICIGESAEELNRLYCYGDGTNCFEEDKEVYAHAIVARHRSDKKLNKRYVIVLNPNYKSDKITPGIIAHEALHITTFLLHDVGVVFDPDNEEPYAYFLGWVVDEVYKFLEEKEIKIE